MFTKEILGLTDYHQVYKLQVELHNAAHAAKINDKPTENHLILCEHPHVYTLGKSGDVSNLLITESFLNSVSATFVKTDRGGDITYHGPGQLVGYPVLDLDSLNLGIRAYIVSLENIIINVLKIYNIHAVTSDKAIGVWLDFDSPKARKIAAIGVKVSKGITMHGFALNINTNLNYFNYINPCGFTDKGVTSMQKELGRFIMLEEVSKRIEKEFLKTFFPLS